MVRMGQNGRWQRQPSPVKRKGEGGLTWFLNSLQRWPSDTAPAYVKSPVCLILGQ
jgi:hypothetical protein